MHGYSWNGVVFYRLYSLATNKSNNTRNNTFEASEFNWDEQRIGYSPLTNHLLLQGLFVCTNFAVLRTNKALLA